MKAVILMLVRNVLQVGFSTLSKAAMAEGLSNYILVTYIHAIGILILIPSAFLYHRNIPLPPIRCTTILQIIVLAFMSYSFSILIFTGLHYSSPMLASAISNLSLAFTFTIALIFRMEILDLCAKSSILKLIGTIVSISGALVVIFYQGLSLAIFSSPTNQPSLNSLDVQLQTQSNWVIGGIFLTVGCILYSLTYVMKTWIARDFPSEVLITLIIFFVETILAAIVTFFVENDARVWTPTTYIELITILYGALAMGVVNTVDTWACKVKGPVFVAMFSPIDMIVAIIMGVSFLGDILHLGSVIGGLIIALGFYTVMKGKAEEQMLKRTDENSLTYSTEDNLDPLIIPMLHDKSLDA